MTNEDWRPIINKCDPLYLIEAGAPRDEYDDYIPEIATKATSCLSIEELALLIREVFFKVFGDSVHDEHDRYRAAAEEAWLLLHVNEK